MIGPCTAHDLYISVIYSLHWLFFKKKQDNKIFLSEAGMFHFFSQSNTFKSAICNTDLIFALTFFHITIALLG